jgi:hypothetical protein
MHEFGAIAHFQGDLWASDECRLECARMLEAKELNAILIGGVSIRNAAAKEVAEVNEV